MYSPGEIYTLIQMVMSLFLLLLETSEASRPATWLGRPPPKHSLLQSYHLPLATVIGMGLHFRLSEILHPFLLLSGTRQGVTSDTYLRRIIIIRYQ